MLDTSAPDVKPPASPPWGWAAKLVVGLVFVVIVGGLIARFRDMIGPLVFSLILAYLLNPLIIWLTTKLRLSWGMAVNLVYLVALIVLVAGLAAAVIAIIFQVQLFYKNFVVDSLPDLPDQLRTLLSQPFAVGPFTIDPAQPLQFGPFTLDISLANLQPIFQQVINAIQPALSQLGVFISSLAAGTASLAGWLFFVLIVSFYLSHDFRRLAPSVERLVPPGYAADAKKLLSKLGPIWQAYLRGQVTLATIMGIAVGLTMGAMGVQYAPVLGLLSGLMDFIPIVGPYIAAGVSCLVAVLQGENWFGIHPIYFMLLVLLVHIILQQVEGLVLSPRIIGRSLNLHPVLIMICAIIGTNLAGIVGLVLVSPTLATLRLFTGYIYHKVFDMDPWLDEPVVARPAPIEQHWLIRLRRWWRDRRARAQTPTQPPPAPKPKSKAK